MSSPEEMAALVDETRRDTGRRVGMTEVDADVNAPALSEAVPAPFDSTRSGFAPIPEARRKAYFQARPHRRRRVQGVSG